MCVLLMRLGTTYVLSSSSRLHDDYSTALVLTQASQVGHPGVKVCTLYICTFADVCMYLSAHVQNGVSSQLF